MEAEKVEVTKVTMNMAKRTIEDLNAISKLTENTNKTNIVGTALRVYRRLIELQEGEKSKLIVEDKEGNLTRMELVH